ncbi:MAG: heavy-metal-associated domain-containing protein [Flavobacterium lindanitolerans]|jgi:periplasmic mercuric ion binding protein|uniref:heavy-metal-associated domain-containing protein n=1 Tax=Flavobacterium TaxID=237 RepID=UPI0015BD0FCA|nr:heavy-metal-associated domain-containing protein [Flavobacterium lindanitolerans]MBL7867232.1 heavy-metal-associated domain-containing protein [Flavobacterium lindanitolerans]NWL00028.1 ATPase P [Flavobacterium collinsii]
MNKKILIAIFGFTLLSFQADAQCCAASSNKKTITENSDQKNGVTVKLKITGMTCAGCANHISKALKNVNGVIEQSVEYPGDVAIVKYDSAKTKPEELIKAIEKAGYKAEVIKPNTKA